MCVPSRHVMLTANGTRHNVYHQHYHGEDRYNFLAKLMVYQALTGAEKNSAGSIQISSFIYI